MQEAEPGRQRAIHSRSNTKYIAVDWNDGFSSRPIASPNGGWGQDHKTENFFSRDLRANLKYTPRYGLGIRKGNQNSSMWYGTKLCCISLPHLYGPIYRHVLSVVAYPRPRLSALICYTFRYQSKVNTVFSVRLSMS